MNYCNKCQVNLANNITFCPLCGSYIVRKEIAAQNSQYNKVNLSSGFRLKIVILLSRILSVAMIICSAIAILNLLQPNFSINNWWFIYAAASAIAVKFGILDMINKQRYSWRDIVFNCILGLAYFVFIDWYALGLKGFSISIVAPLAFVLGGVILTVFSLNNTLNPISTIQAFAIILILSTLLTVFNILMFYFSTIKPAFVPSLVSLIVIAVNFIILIFSKLSKYGKALINNFKLK